MTASVIQCRDLEDECVYGSYYRMVVLLMAVITMMM